MTIPHRLEQRGMETTSEESEAIIVTGPIGDDGRSSSNGDDDRKWPNDCGSCSYREFVTPKVLEKAYSLGERPTGTHFKGSMAV